MSEFCELKREMIILPAAMMSMSQMKYAWDMTKMNGVKKTVIKAVSTHKKMSGETANPGKKFFENPLKASINPPYILQVSAS
jgi:hypothetical protein